MTSINGSGAVGEHDLVELSNNLSLVGKTDKVCCQ